MPWIRESPIFWVHRLCFYVLKWGSIPKHIAIIMDGNRRYAKKKYVERIEGHKQGFDKLTETLQWCLELEVYEVTVYAFSIENFKRNKDEVDTLLDLARQKFIALINEWEKLKEHGVCIRIIGNLTYLPKDLILLMMISMLLTKDNNRAFLNIAFSYTSKDEISNTACNIANGLRNADIKCKDVDEEFFDQCLYTHQSPHPELVIRTSGEYRLSDFLTWQSAESYIHFSNVLWPEFSAWNFMSAIFCYQHYFSKRSKTVSPSKAISNNINDEYCKSFPDVVQRDRLKTLAEMYKDDPYANLEKLVNFSSEELYDYFKTHFDS